MTSNERKLAFHKLYDSVIDTLPPNSEFRMKACGDFVMVDVFAVDKRCIYTSKTSHHFEDGEYVQFVSDPLTEEGMTKLIKYTRELYLPERQLSFVAELLGVNLSDMVLILKKMDQMT